jgi:hypothetical protein
MNLLWNLIISSFLFDKNYIWEIEKEKGRDRARIKSKQVPRVDIVFRSEVNQVK